MVTPPVKIEVSVAPYSPQVVTGASHLIEITCGLRGADPLPFGLANRPSESRGVVHVVPCAFGPSSEFVGIRNHTAMSIAGYGHIFS